MSVSIALSLIIAKFFPAVHNQVVSRATRLEHQSLYWGTVIVSNVLVGMSLSLRVLIMREYLHPNAVVYTAAAAESAVHIILFIGALCSHRGTNVPVPKGIAQGITRAFLFLALILDCISTILRKQFNKERVLVLFTLMSFVYRSIMDAISVTFLLFIEKSRATTVSFTFLYISFVIFLLLTASFMFLHEKATLPCLKKMYKCFVALFFLVAVFGAVMLMIVVYLIIMFSLNLQGVGGIVTGLIPSIGLSAASWYIKKRLLPKALSSSNAAGEPETVHGANGGAVNDDRRNDERMLLP